MRVLTGNKQQVPVKAWIDGVPLDHKAEQQLREIAMLPFIHKHVAVMPDAHVGVGSTVGSVIPTKGAIIPAAVGVDIGCGMIARRLNVPLDMIYEKRKAIYEDLVTSIPHGRTDNGGLNDVGRWQNEIPCSAGDQWSILNKEYLQIVDKHPTLNREVSPLYQLGTLGGGNHFIEICEDEESRPWIMLHSGSRGVGNRIGTYFTKLAQSECDKWHTDLPNRDLAFLPEGTEYHDEYVKAVGWAQEYAKANREIMMGLALGVITRATGIPSINVWTTDMAVNCHHNYVEKENHYGANVFVTRKGAVRAREGDMGIIPGAMGRRSFIVRGKGNPQSFNSCSHGAGRILSRSEAKRHFTVADHMEATRDVVCRKDEGVLDETPGAYKDIDAVMAAQSDLVEVVHTLKAHICVKG